MSTPVHRAPTRQPSVAVAAARQRQERSRAGGSSGNPVQRALLQMQSSAGNRAATVAVQRVRGATLETVVEETEEMSRPSTPDSFHTAQSGSTRSSSSGSAQSFHSVSEGAPLSVWEPGSEDERSSRRASSASAASSRASTDSGRSSETNREPEGEEGPAPKPADDILKKVTEALDRIKKDLDPVDNLSKGVQVPTAAGIGQVAAASGNTAEVNAAAASGTAASGMSGLTELIGTVTNGFDAVRNWATSRKKTSGAAHHTARKKGKVKAGDTAVGLAGTGGYGAGMAKDGTKLAAATNTATAAEVSGIFGAITGSWKSVRASIKTARAASTLHGLRQLEDPQTAHSEVLDRLREQVNAATGRVVELEGLLATLQSIDPAERPVEWTLHFDTVTRILVEANSGAAQAIVAYQRADQDIHRLGDFYDYTKTKKGSKIGKELVGGTMGEGAKAAGGILAAVTAAGVLGSNPAGWITAAVGAGLILGVGGYKAGRAMTKRYQEARYPERYTPEGEEPMDAKSWGAALRHSLKVWKKVSKHERNLVAHNIYRMAAGPDVPGSEGTAPELRASARQLLIVLKAGPTQHKMNETQWEASLDNPDHKADWVKEIAEQIASG